MKDASLHTNHELAEANLAQLNALGVQTLCICPGARNSPWIHLLENDPRFQLLSFFDERAASFFALGRSKASQLPVAILTTSGTAVGELLPALMEAFYSGVSLIALTADRPKRFRGTGAPQSAEQNNIFGVYSRTHQDLDRESKLTPSLQVKFPYHLNVCFEEPLPSSEENRILKNETIVSDSKNFKNPLLIIGELTRRESELLIEPLLKASCPVITEPLSHLREIDELSGVRVKAHRDLWTESQNAGYLIDSVVKIGGVPTLRFWRDLEIQAAASRIPVISLSSLPFSGLPRASSLYTPPAEWINTHLPRGSSLRLQQLQNWQSIQKQKSEKLKLSLDENPLSEPALIRSISELIPRGSQVYLGNSLPIREWDLAAVSTNSQFDLSANRGLNGIDGQISSFFGGLNTDRENWAILGDLTTLYDLSAPWILTQLDPKTHFKLVVINNSGGRIFDRIFKSKRYTNEHQIQFKDWAKQWNLSYTKIDKRNFSREELSPFQVVEIVPCEEQTRAFWNRWDPTSA